MFKKRDNTFFILFSDSEHVKKQEEKGTTSFDLHSFEYPYLNLHICVKCVQRTVD